jgi:two-component system, NarL family, nitrate/nitrite response regulator NarL
MKKISFLLMEDNRLLRDSIAGILKSYRGIKFLNISENIRITTANTRKTKPDIILLGLGIFNRNSLSAFELVQNNYPDSKLILIDFAPVAEDTDLFQKAGAAGFIFKDATIDDFIIKIHAVAENHTSPDLTLPVYPDRNTNNLRTIKTKIEKTTEMTKRECEVIKWISDGSTNKEIGSYMNISTFTVKSHIHNIMEKLTLHSRLELANYNYSSEKLN